MLGILHGSWLWGVHAACCIAKLTFSCAIDAIYGLCCPINSFAAASLLHKNVLSRIAAGLIWHCNISGLLLRLARFIG